MCTSPEANETSERKAGHLRLAVEEGGRLQFQGLTAGWERVRLVHRALPELDLAAVDTAVTIFGHRLQAPLLISSMTGGTPEATLINRRLARAAQAAGVAMGLGSMRVALDDPTEALDFQVREAAPDILLFANLGAVQLNYGYGLDDCRRAVELAQADALILHLNPLQEAIQPGGNTNFAGLLRQIEQVCRALPVPVIVKEVGWGISGEVARQLVDVGVAGIDVAGAGGTDWAAVEARLADEAPRLRLAQVFAQWGIPTVEAVPQVRQAAPEAVVIASGGVRNGLDVAKAIALGADAAGLAMPFLQAAARSAEAVKDELAQLTAELKLAMFATGCANLAALRQAQRSTFQVPSSTFGV